MRKLLLLGMLIFSAVIVGLVLAFRFLPWWGSLGLVVAVVFGVKFVVSRAVPRLLSVPFKWKGAVLRGAAIQVHSVAPASAPPDGNVEEAKPVTGGNPFAKGSTAGSQTPREYYQLDVTVTPGRATGKFTHWAPVELVLVKPESKLSLKSASGEDDACKIKRIEIEQEGRFEADQGWSFAGPQRLKLLLAVQPGTQRLKFRYYFEEFGSVQLPEPQRMAA